MKFQRPFERILIALWDILRTRITFRCILHSERFGVTSCVALKPSAWNVVHCSPFINHHWIITQRTNAENKRLEASRTMITSRMNKKKRFTYLTNVFLWVWHTAIWASSAQALYCTTPHEIWPLIMNWTSNASLCARLFLLVPFIPFPVDWVANHVNLPSFPWMFLFPHTCAYQGHWYVRNYANKKHLYCM